MTNRGDPLGQDQVKGWKKISDLARAIQKHISKGKVEDEPDFSLAHKKATLFRESWLAKQKAN